ncbi:hypothetical protein L1987_32514 [Smallanthus sonchifolius]|uniref:Uncharacterized protein n=1 Tax=Smallanthus sonchifolius TaxID=185202 RepID=A0ACB9HMX3_9ASTR|nr:hypothetical protein L1987_32514 [Smallanthus sonchifolius]
MSAKAWDGKPNAREEKKTQAKEQRICCKEGWEELKIKYLGGLHVLLTFKKYSDANEFVENKLKWSNMFSDLVVWKGQDYRQERIVWLKINGVSAHLWESHIFDNIASSMGKVIAPSHASFENGALITDMVGIIVGSDWNIQEEIILKWREKSYNIRCKEDDDDWCPGWCSKTKHGCGNIKWVGQDSLG